MANIQGKLRTIKKQLAIVICLAVYLSCPSREVYFWERIEYSCPSWISSERIVIVRLYQDNKITEDAWGNIAAWEILSQQIALCEVDLSGSIVRRDTITEQEHASMNFSVNNTSAAVGYVFMGMRISDDMNSFEMFRMNRDNNELLDLGLGYYPEASTDGRKIVYNKFTIENQSWMNNGLWIKNVDGSGDAICLADSVRYGAMGPDDLIAYCWCDTLYVVDTTGTIQYKWYAGPDAGRPSWSSSPDTVLVSTTGKPRLVVLASGDYFELPVHMGYDVRWSPDGSRFTYRTYGYDAGWDYYLIDRDGSNKILLNWE